MGTNYLTGKRNFLAKLSEKYSLKYVQPNFLCNVMLISAYFKDIKNENYRIICLINRDNLLKIHACKI